MTALVWLVAAIALEEWRLTGVRTGGVPAIPGLDGVGKRIRSGLVDGLGQHGYALKNSGRYVDPRRENVVDAAGRATPWGRAWQVGNGLGNALNSIAPEIGLGLAGTLGGLVSLYNSDLEEKIENEPAARVLAAEANGQCPDPCDKASKGLRDARERANNLGSCPERYLRF